MKRSSGRLRVNLFHKLHMKNLIIWTTRITILTISLQAWRPELGQIFSRLLNSLIVHSERSITSLYHRDLGILSLHFVPHCFASRLCVVRYKGSKAIYIEHYLSDVSRQCKHTVSLRIQ